MRRVSLGNPIRQPDLSDPFDKWVMDALLEIQNASFDDDAMKIADAYTVSNYTATRTLDASSATAADVAAVLCTLLDDMRKRGVKKGL